MIEAILKLLEQHEQRVGSSVNFTPSENRLSPLARLPLVCDLNARYFLDDLRIFGSWAFHGGKEAGMLGAEILHPLLRMLTRARYVNTRALSGLNCMTIALAATTRPGDLVLAIGPEGGGHASTSVVVENLGRRFATIPMMSPHDLDEAGFARLLQVEAPALVYVDQGTMLFPLDSRPLRDALDLYAPNAVLHYDSSHINGLVLGGALPNPLERGADLFGGSTHKTLPGPHKAFLATNSEALATKITAVAEHFVSHHQAGAEASLAITLLEFQECGGADYCANTIANAKAFARGLHEAGVTVAASERGFTACHQLWVTPPEQEDVGRLALDFERCGFIINTFPGLPGIPRPALRLSMAEATRMGGDAPLVQELVEIFADLILRRTSVENAAARVKPLHAALSRTRYCFNRDQLAARGLENLVKALWRRAGYDGLE